MRNAFRFLWGECLSVASKSDVVLRHAGGELAVAAYPGQPLPVFDVFSGFQEEIPRAYELRVAWVDGRCFAGHLDTGGDDVVDWRNTHTELTWTRGEVPQDIQHKLGQVMERLDLVSGAFDLMVTPDGEYVFLEVNPDGEWGMLEKWAGLPISDAYADALLRGVQ